MPLPNQSPNDSPLRGALASLLVLVAAAWLGDGLVRDARGQAGVWGEPRPLEFALTERSGVAVTAQGLRGNAAVVAFFFTRCTQSCPAQMQALKKLHGDLAGSGVKLICISAEGGHDTTAVLQEYATKVGAGADWLFLTGDVDAIRRLAAGPFLASLAENAAEPIGRHISHSSRLYFVDKAGRVVGQGEAVKPDDPLRPDPAFAVDEAALRKAKLTALDLQHEAWLGLADLPHVNAALNGAAAALLLCGWALIRAKLPAAHGATMVAAFLTSSLFLVSYLYYHRYAGDTRFAGTGPLRTFYLGLLASHVFLAIVTVPLVLITLWKAARSNFAGHRRIARWTLPIWLYVSVTGLAVYFFLYQWFPG